MARSFREVWAKVRYEVSSSASMIFGPLTDLFFWFIVSCVLISMYPFISLWVAWTFSARPLVSFTVAWYIIIRRRIKNYLTSLLAPQKTYDVDSAVRTYVKLLEEQEKERRKTSARADPG